MSFAKKSIAALSPWYEAILAFAYPNVCQICKGERATAAEGYVCATCWQEVRFIKPPFCRRCGLPYEGSITSEFDCENCREMDLHFHCARSAVRTNKFISEIIQRYKYGRELWFEPFLTDLLIREIAPFLREHQVDLLVPVPLHPAKKRERGFNQAERLARRLGKATGLPVNSKLVKRVKFTETQTKLRRDQRAKNMANAFAATGKRLQGQSVMLLDDVFTTGATTDACAKVLLAAGAGRLTVWTVTRGL